MAKARRSGALGAAECARRTGLTVRALRVYERYGLILPKRSPQGWRLYGPKDLIRLNAILALKALGMTLSQIREALTGSAPSLLRVLRMQLSTQRKRKAATDRVIGSIELALAKLDGDQQLSLDELCALLKDADGRRERRPVMQDLSAVLTTAEMREWRAIEATLPKRAVAETQELYRSTRLMLLQFRALMEQAADPACDGAQVLLARQNELALKYRVRVYWLARAGCNPVLTRKVFAYFNGLLERATAPDPSMADGQLLDYMRAVRCASRWWLALQKLHALAQGLSERRADPGSSVAEELARRFTRVCRANDLGDATEYALWQRDFGVSKVTRNGVRYDSASRGGWEFLAGAAQRLSDRQDR